MNASEAVVGARIRVVNAPSGEENAWLQNLTGIIVQNDGPYLKVLIDDHPDTVWLDLPKIAPEEKEPAPKEGETTKVESGDALPPLSQDWKGIESILEIRESQLKASLLREKGKDEEIERLKGLLREAVLYVNGRSQTSIRLSESIKAAVTGAKP